MNADDRGDPRPDQEGFGEATLGEAQAESPPVDPDYLEDAPAGPGDDDGPAQHPGEEEISES